MKYLKTHYGTCIATYLPREGPETCPVIQISFCFSSYSYLSTSRGAGNKNHFVILSNNFMYRYLSTSGGAGNESFSALGSVNWRYSYLSTSRGAGNLPLNKLTILNFLYSYLSTSRGTGNSWLAFTCCSNSFKYRYLSTSRGAGNCVNVDGYICIERSV